MHSSRPPRGGSSPAALPALLRASHLFGLALGSALGKLCDSGVTAARMFERAEESALLCGDTNRLDRAIGRFAIAYADQTESDHAALVKAIKTGKIQARRGI
jgi:hypothetical protein